MTLPAEPEHNIPQMEFKSTENAYMAWKTTDLELRRKIQAMEPKEAKKLHIANGIEIRDNYDAEMRLMTMTELIRQKFSVKNPELMQKLIDTGDVPLIEGNQWGDTFYGFCFDLGYGMNHLGRILMERRRELINENA